MRQIRRMQGTGGFLLALVLVSAIAGLAGGVLANQILVARPPATMAVVAGPVAEAGGEWLRVESSAWERHRPDSQLGDLLARSGGPAGHLQVRITLQNPTARPQAISRQEFRLHARSGASWPPAEGSMPATTLGPRQALSSVLVFDVPETAAGLQLVWTKDAQEVRIPIGDDASSQGQAGAGWGAVTQHQEGKSTSN